MAGFYHFIRRVSGKLGVGVADEGFLGSNTLPNYSGIGADRQVMRTMMVQQTPFYEATQAVPTVSPLGLTGSVFHGVSILGPLAKKG